MLWDFNESVDFEAAAHQKPRPSTVPFLRIPDYIHCEQLVIWSEVVVVTI